MLFNYMTLKNLFMKRRKGMSKPTTDEMVQLIRVQLINCDGMNDQEYMAWKEIMRIVKENKQQ